MNWSGLPAIEPGKQGKGHRSLRMLLGKASGELHSETGAGRAERENQRLRAAVRRLENDLRIARKIVADREDTSKTGSYRGILAQERIVDLCDKIEELTQENLDLKKEVKEFKEKYQTCLDLLLSKNYLSIQDLPKHEKNTSYKLRGQKDIKVSQTARKKINISSISMVFKNASLLIEGDSSISKKFEYILKRLIKNLTLESMDIFIKDNDVVENIMEYENL